jgi:antitoxin CptB
MPDDRDHLSPAAAGDLEPPEAADVREHRLQQLRWRSRRGLLELELLLLPFADECLIALDARALDAYERLLACEDLDVYDWLQHRARAPEPELDAIVGRIASYLGSAAGR